MASCFLEIVVEAQFCAQKNMFLYNYIGKTNLIGII